jgi:hypothetical protein
MTIDFPRLPGVVVPFVLAQAVAPQFSWTQTLLVYGPLGLWVAWFVIRDRLDREERKQERADQERRHQENLAAQRAVENAFRTNTNSIILAMAATKHMDAAFTDLLQRIKDDNLDGGT